LFIYPSLRPIDDVIPITLKERPLASGLILGDPEAPVVIEVFEDFQCPACRRFTEKIEPQVVETYINTGLAQLIYRHNPFIGQESFQASNASMCANEQGRFWDYHDILFTNQTGENIGAFSDRRLEAFAETITLDMTAFNACFRGNDYKDEINDDLARGRKYGVRATPTVVINGQPQPDFAFATIQNAVEFALATSE
ncbi:MAG: DsbA family protein, partial [Anaerolineales bacterium]